MTYGADIVGLRCLDLDHQRHWIGYSPRTPPSGFALYLPGTGRFSRNRLGQRLPPGGEVPHLPDDPALLCGTRAVRRREPPDRVDDGESGPDRPPVSCSFAFG